jgi:hypothetical protein
MPKPTKSSASSGTRKKHARKAAEQGQDGPPQPQQSKPKPKKGLKMKGNHKGGPPPPPPKKVYIPPSKLKPQATRLDPLETTGLVHRLPAELVVCLRGLGKRSGMTRVRSLEELKATWIEKCIVKKEDSESSWERESNITVLVDMIPVWVRQTAVSFQVLSLILCLITASSSTISVSPPFASDQAADRVYPFVIYSPNSRDETRDTKCSPGTSYHTTTLEIGIQRLPYSCRRLRCGYGCFS